MVRTLEQVDNSLAVIEALLDGSPVTDQPELSFPIAEKALNATQWQAVSLPSGSGILDRGGRPFWLTSPDNGKDEMTLTVSSTTGTAEAAILGFFFQMKQSVQVPLPYVSTKTTYFVGLELDPTRLKDPLGPIRRVVHTNTVPYTAGRIFLPCWDVIRQPNQLLTDATVIQRRPKISPTIHVDYPENRPDPRTQLWGAQCYIRYGSESGTIYIADGESEATGGPTKWTNLTNPEWKNITLSGGHTAAVPAQYRISRGYIEMRGLVRRNAGDFPTTSSSTIGWLTGVSLPDVNIPIGGSGGRNALLTTAMGDSVRDNLVVHTPIAGTRQVSLDNIRVPLP